MPQHGLIFHRQVAVRVSGMKLFFRKEFLTTRPKHVFENLFRSAAAAHQMFFFSMKNILRVVSRTFEAKQELFPVLLFEHQEMKQKKFIIKCIKIPKLA